MSVSENWHMSDCVSTVCTFASGGDNGGFGQGVQPAAGQSERDM